MLRPGEIGQVQQQQRQDESVRSPSSLLTPSWESSSSSSMTATATATTPMAVLDVATLLADFEAVAGATRIHNTVERCLDALNIVLGVRL